MRLDWQLIIVGPVFKYAVSCSGCALQITFNGGAQWSELRKPDTYNFPSCNRCEHVSKCQLHLHGPTGWVEGPGTCHMPLYPTTLSLSASASVCLSVHVPKA